MAKKIRTYEDAVRAACLAACSRDGRTLEGLSTDAGHAGNWYARKLLDGRKDAKGLALRDVDELAGTLGIPAAKIAREAGRLLDAALAELADGRARRQGKPPKTGGQEQTESV